MIKSQYQGIHPAQSIYEMKMVQLHNGLAELTEQMKKAIEVIEGGKELLSYKDGEALRATLITLSDYIGTLRAPDPTDHNQGIQETVDQWLFEMVEKHHLDPALLDDETTPFDYTVTSYNNETTQATGEISIPSTLLDLLADQGESLKERLDEYGVEDLGLEQEIITYEEQGGGRESCLT